MLQLPDLLIGCGPTHLRWIARHAAARRKASMPWTWVVPHPRACFAPALLDWMARGATAAPPLVDLPRLAEAAGARLIVDPIERLDTQDRALTLACGESLRWRHGSIDALPLMPRSLIDEALPGARTHALFAWPLEPFAQIWQRMGPWLGERARHIVVIGCSAHALSLAAATLRAVRQSAGGRVTVVLDGTPAASGAERLAALRADGVTVLPDHCTGLAAGQVLLACGGQLICDAAILASRTQAPGWAVDTELDAVRQVGKAGDRLLWPLSLSAESHAWPVAERIHRAAARAPIAPRWARVWCRISDRRTQARLLALAGVRGDTHAMSLNPGAVRPHADADAHAPAASQPPQTHAFSR